MERWDGSSNKAWCAAAGDSGAAGEMGYSRKGRWWSKERTTVVAGEGYGCNCWSRGLWQQVLVASKVAAKGEDEEAAVVKVCFPFFPDFRTTISGRVVAAMATGRVQQRFAARAGSRGNSASKGGEEDDDRRLGREATMERSSTSTVRESGERPPMERKEMNLPTMCSEKTVQKLTPTTVEAATTLPCAGEVEGRDTAVGPMLP
ncbi:hypothetical protein B296_00025055 [Ensete ventricosum]|uniref:Uncharacterized protein n=1 Tax=Ensete ventricosum TaxID=4639 RepID=A0A426YME4_ENSVE|nr:hypothetical protein B296_00025055 [Ensete ventricosum]